MSALRSAIAQRKKAVASTLVVSLVVGIPLTIAALHPGFPVNDVDLASRDVWVTNGDQLLGGRLNRQIDELNGSVTASSAAFQVLQNGDTLFLVDPVAGRVESVSPSTTEVTSSIDIPPGSEVSYGGDTLAIVSPAGDLWTTNSVGDLVFNYAQTDPLIALGAGGHAVITEAGAVVAVSSEEKAIYRIESPGSDIVESPFPAIGKFQLTAVGEEAIAFDTTTSTVVTEGGSKYPVDGPGYRVQQVGAENNAVYVATGDSLVAVDLGSGEVSEASAGIDTPMTGPDEVSAPVYLDGCAHGAWAGAQRYLLACDDADPNAQDIAESTRGGELEFRVNRSVIALNNLVNGNVWLVEENMRLVDNWEDVTPPEELDGEQGEEKSATQSLADTLAERTETNRPPTAADDVFGVRPGRTTILAALDNDTDPDGDVLVITNHDDVAETTGKLDYIDGARALQFTPAKGFVGSVSFGYQISDGRPGGIASARVTANVRPTEINEEPQSQRLSATTTEANQTVSYNVLNDWRDPDGDDLYLVGASPKSGDLVRFTPDGLITFSHRTSELGVKEVAFQVSDGIGAPMTGTLTVDVQSAGTLDPIGTPDFAATFTGEPVVISPLENDLSPSGDQLSLASATEAGAGSSVAVNGDFGTITFSAPNPGVYYVTYTLAAGARTSVGIIRIDVTDVASGDPPPVAVKDTAYLRGDAPTTVSVLSNDVSPTGRILAVQSIAVDPALTARGLVVELLESTLVRITSPQALTEQVSFTYTISDGVNVATAGVTVVPVPPLTKHQPPVAIDDNVKVRAGDIVTVPVLSNDFHPDDSIMKVATELTAKPSDGIAFVNSDTVRFQAPMTAGQYTAVYGISDLFGETGAATVTFTVTADDEAGNRSPTPVPIIARVLSGGSIRVDLPLDGVDPDGDSVQLLGFPVGPTLGSISEQGPGYFVYESAAGVAGTDEFSYEVVDAYGATGLSSAKIAVIPKPPMSLPPNAVPDSVLMRPGKTAQIDLMANDSDPQGALIKVARALIDVPDDIEAEVVDRRFLVVTAPDEVMSFSLRYTLSNNLGGSSVSYVQVQVTPDAPLLPPTAEDVVLSTADIAGEAKTTVNIFDSAFNPSGRTEDLEVSLEGPNASSALLLTAGRVEITPRSTRQAITYRVTNTIDDLDALAFIVVPAAATDAFDDPPIIDPSLPPQIISMNETKEWKLSDIVFAPSGRDVIITDRATVTAVQSNGKPLFVDDTTIRFTPVLDYRGAASITFTVTDGANPKDPKGNIARLTLPITVGDPEFRDTPPTFTPPSINVEVGEEATVDLRASTAHPNPQILGQVTYSNITSSSARLTTALSGSTVTVSTPRNTPKGTTFTLDVLLRWDKFEIPGTINVTVVTSSRPLAVAVTDQVEAARGDGATVVPVLSNDSNPFLSTGESLRLLSATVANSGQPATVSVSGDNVRIVPNPNLKSGQIDVTYRIGDATEDPDREINGTATLIVSDVPDQIAMPAREPDQNVGGDQSATFRFAAPATNGKPITSYEWRTNMGQSGTNCSPGAACTISGLVNGESYIFSVRAINERGAGAWSLDSSAVTPYGTPGQPAPALTSQSKWAPAALTWTWPLVAGSGGQTTYSWTASSGERGSGVDLRSATISGKGAGGYTVSVVATNSGGKAGAMGTSASATVRTQPAPTAPQNVSASRSSATAPSDISFSWSAPSNATADAAGDGLSYTWRTSTGATGSGPGTTARINNQGQGNYTITVTAQNSGGAGPAATSNSVNVQQTPPAPANPTVTLRADPQNQSGPFCVSGGCHKYDVTLSDFPTNDHTIEFYCQGPDGSATFSGNRYLSTKFCGYSGIYVVVDGVRSNEVNFNF